MSRTMIFSGGGPWTLDDAREDGIVFSAQAQNTEQNDIIFSVSGSSMYLVGVDVVNGVEVNQYNLSTPFDPSTAAFSQAVSVSAQARDPEGVDFRTNGLKMFVTSRGAGVGPSAQSVFEYAMTSAWSVSTASFTTSVGVTANAPLPESARFKPDGTKMFVLSTDSEPGEVVEYSLSSAWSVSTASFVQSFSLPSQTTNRDGLVLGNNGKTMFVCGTDGATKKFVHEFNLTSAWDISTANFKQEFVLAGPASQGIAANNDGTKLFYLFNNNVRQLSL